MIKASVCRSVYQGHCNHWGLTEPQHALAHALGRLINEVAVEDEAAGIPLASATSATSVAGDGPRLEAFLAEEGYALVRIVTDG